MKKLRTTAVMAALLILLTLIIISNFWIPSSTYSIRADGSVIPSTLPIKRNGNLYTLTEDIEYGLLTVKRSNIIIEGNGHTSVAVILDHVNNITIQNLNIESGRYTIFLDHSSNNKIINTDHDNHPISLYHSHNNIISENTNLAVWLTESNNNTVSNNIIHRIELTRATNNLILRNNITIEEWFVWLQLTDSSNNLIFGNQIDNASDRWISLFGTSTKNMFVANQVTGPFVTESYFQAEDNLFYHNNFIDAFQFINPSTEENNQTNNWDNGQDGNYWSNYQGQDTNHDGIGDTPHNINSFNQDNYPLINPINLETEPQPQLTLSETDQSQLSITTLALVAILFSLIVAIAIYKKSILLRVFNKLDKKSYTLAATGSLLSGAFLFAAIHYGFGDYLTYPFRGGWATSGQLHRTSLIFLTALAFSILLAGLGYRKQGKTQKDPLVSYKLILVIITSIILFYAAILIAQAHPIYIQGAVGPYWNRCFFQDLDDSIQFTQLTITIFALLGITQISWGKTQQKTQAYPRNRNLGLITGKLLMISGIIFLLAILPLYLFPFNSKIPLYASLLFLVTQILSSITFLISRNPKTEV